MDVGIEIGQYRIVEHIGRGGMADVWSAYDERLSRTVAVKTIARDLALEQDPVKMFEREAKTIAALEHPFILPVYDFGEFEGKLYIVMRFVTGGSLDDLLDKKSLSYKEGVRLGRYISAALDHAHGESVVHLDLKPPNILMDSRGAPYLADFGLAAVMGPEGRTRNPGSGTLLYMAPEQLTAEELDHRVDVYAFTLVVFRILTGRLPFNASVPLALRQLQMDDAIPDITSLQPDLPKELNEIMRKGTAPNPEHRYAHASDLMNDIEQVMGVTGGVDGKTAPDSGQSPSRTASLSDFLHITDPSKVQIQEAQDIYEKAHLAWAGGQGRFLLSVTHYMVMCDYYVNASSNGLSYDKSGAQMLLRGALEYDYKLEYWWRRVSIEDRRWVCLHTIRSENLPARIRSFKLLETLEDRDPPQIPLQVAQAIQLESSQEGLLAAINVLAVRASHINQQLDKEQPRDWLDEIHWHDYMFSPEIDGLVAEVALKNNHQTVAELAARTIGKMRSTAAVDKILVFRTAGDTTEDGLSPIEAFAYILDEALSLPPQVGILSRIGGWLLNTWYRLSDEPLQLVWGFLWAVLGGWLGMGYHVWSVFRTQAIFSQQRITNTLAMGLLFGFFLGITTLMGHTFPYRLRRFWPSWTRFVWSAISAYFLSQLLWWSYVWMYLNLDPPSQDIMVIVGVGTAVGLILPTVLHLRGWVSFTITTLATYGTLFIAFDNFWKIYNGLEPNFGMGYTAWILAYDSYSHAFTIMLPLVIVMAIGMHFPALTQDLRDLFRWLMGERSAQPTDIGLSQFISEQETKFGQNTVPLNVNATRQEKPLPSAEGTTKLEQPIIPNVQQMTVDVLPVTEEFDLAQVGGKLSSDTQTSWDNILGAIDDMTEEYDLSSLGGDISEANDPQTQMNTLVDNLQDTAQQIMQSMSAESTVHTVMGDLQTSATRQYGFDPQSQANTLVDNLQDTAQQIMQSMSAESVVHTVMGDLQTSATRQYGFDPQAQANTLVDNLQDTAQQIMQSMQVGEQSIHTVVGNLNETAQQHFPNMEAKQDQASDDDPQLKG